MRVDEIDICAAVNDIARAGQSALDDARATCARAREAVACARHAIARSHAIVAGSESWMREHAGPPIGLPPVNAGGLIDVKAKA